MSAEILEAPFGEDVSFIAVDALLLDLHDHEAARAGRFCNCVKCRVLQALDRTTPRPSIAHFVGKWG